MKIHINKFVRRQTLESGFSHWTISDEELLTRIQAGLPFGKTGYKAGDKLVGEFKARHAIKGDTKMTPDEAKVRLKQILDTMDVPLDRKTLGYGDIAWLGRNITIRNRNHSDLQESYRLIRLIKNYYDDTPGAY